MKKLSGSTVPGSISHIDPTAIEHGGEQNSSNTHEKKNNSPVFKTMNWRSELQHQPDDNTNQSHDPSDQDIVISQVIYFGIHVIILLLIW